MLLVESALQSFSWVCETIPGICIVYELLHVIDGHHQLQWYS